MDMTEVKRFDARVGTLKLSAVVREAGYGSWANPNECVLGRAYRHLTGHSVGDRARFGNEGENYQYWVSRLLHVPIELCSEMDRMCLRKETPTQIADWLESQGY